jgi:hypothetical protein
MVTPIEGGGSASSVCSISPSDMAGQIDNLLERIEALEQAVAELTAANITATQLSDISENGGWIYNVTYMGIEGWIQTPNGTLIPPSGVSLSTLGLLTSTGQQFPIVSMDSDGVLQFGLADDGTVSGGAVGSKDFIEFDTDGTSTSGNLTSPLNSVLDSNGNLSWITYNLGSSPQIKFNTSGIYSVSYQAQILGVDAGIRLPCRATFMSTITSTAIACGASVVDEDEVDISYLNISATFEMPNNRTNLNTGVLYSYLPYIEAMPASGTHNFDTFGSSLMITKLG